MTSDFLDVPVVYITIPSCTIPVRTVITMVTRGVTLLK